MLEVIRQITQMGTKRKNTIVFVSFDGEELCKSHLTSRIPLGWLLGSKGRNISFFSPMSFIYDSVTIFINNVLTYAEHPCSSTGD